MSGLERALASRAKSSSIPESRESASLLLEATEGRVTHTLGGVAPGGGASKPTSVVSNRWLCRSDRAALEASHNCNHL